MLEALLAAVRQPGGASRLRAPRRQARRRGGAAEGHGAPGRGVGGLARRGAGAAGTRWQAAAAANPRAAAPARGLPQERAGARAGVPPRPRRGEHAARRGRRAARALPRPAEPRAASRRPRRGARLRRGAAVAATRRRGVGWVGAVWLDGEGAPVVVARRATSVASVAAAGRSEVARSRRRRSDGPERPTASLAADLNYDFRTDLVLAGAGGLALLRQDEGGRFADVTAETKLPAALLARAGLRRLGRRRRHRRRPRRRGGAGRGCRRSSCATTATARSRSGGRSPGVDARARLRLGRPRRRGRARRGAPRRRRHACTCS